MRDLDRPDCVNVRDLGGLTTAGAGVTASRAVVRADDVRNEAPLRFRRSAWEPGRTPEWIDLRRTAIVILEGVTASREAFGRT